MTAATTTRTTTFVTSSASVDGADVTERDRETDGKVAPQSISLVRCRRHRRRRTETRRSATEDLWPSGNWVGTDPGTVVRNPGTRAVWTAWTWTEPVPGFGKEHRADRTE